MTQHPTILCLASYFKGGLFLEACHNLGCHVILLTEQKLADEAWPRAAIDEFYMMPDLAQQPDITYAVSYLARTRPIDAVIALDDYDVETAAVLREHMRLPGLSISGAKLVRDKLAMRVAAQTGGVPVPEFVQVLNYDRLGEFMARVSPPWVLKPRAEASAMGIKKVHHADEVWSHLESLGDRQSYFLLEQFLPGDVYHVDSIVNAGEIVFTAASRYGRPPMTVYQGGGVFMTSTVPHDTEEEAGLLAINQATLAALGVRHGSSHAEFIRSQADGRFYFLEIGARVGGAGVDMLVEHATGINPWQAWAQLEVARLRGEPFSLPAPRQDSAGLLVSLARQEWPDTRSFADPEIVWRLQKRHHVGLIVRDASPSRVQSLLHSYASRIAAEFTAVEAPLDQAPP
jgi:biotin carboxylase